MNVEDYLDTGERIPILETRTPANALMLCLFFAVARSFDISIKESVNELKTDLLKVCTTCEHIACIGPHELTVPFNRLPAARIYHKKRSTR